MDNTSSLEEESQKMSKSISVNLYFKVRYIIICTQKNTYIISLSSMNYFHNLSTFVKLALISKNRMLLTPYISSTHALFTLPTIPRVTTAVMSNAQFSFACCCTTYKCNHTVQTLLYWLFSLNCMFVRFIHIVTCRCR